MGESKMAITFIEDTEMVSILDRVAKKRGCNRSVLIREAIRRLLKETDK